MPQKGDSSTGIVCQRRRDWLTIDVEGSPYFLGDPDTDRYERRGLQPWTVNGT
ncbi:hypothetical protein [Rhodococcus qingshengii]|uniref:hypothetical protein n=1 Tax=Rhodococcus qingshengii TaxID=334542 RepID=UPI0035D8C2BB